MEQQQTDEKFMRLALNEAEKALEEQEVPIGAVVVADGRIVGRGHNLVETLADATAHAEMQALTAAASTVGGKYLSECTLYVTVEPCIPVPNVEICLPCAVTGVHPLEGAPQPAVEAGGAQTRLRFAPLARYQAFVLDV